MRGIASYGLGESLLGVATGGFVRRKYLRYLGLDMRSVRSVYAPESSSKIEGCLYIRITDCVPDNSRFKSMFSFDFNGDPDKLLIR